MAVEVGAEAGGFMAGLTRPSDMRNVVPTDPTFYPSASTPPAWAVKGRTWSPGQFRATPTPPGGDR